MIVVGKEVVAWVASTAGAWGNYGTEIGIGWARDGELVAGVAYTNWNGANIECHIASDGSRHWLTREFLWTIFDYPFNQVGAARITACIGDGNKDSRRFVEHLGFKLEAVLAGAHPTGGLRIYALFKSECRFLKVKRENLYKMRMRLAA